MIHRTHNIKAELYLAIEIVRPVDLSCNFPPFGIDVPPFKGRDALCYSCNS